MDGRRCSTSTHGRSIPTSRVSITRMDDRRIARLQRRPAPGHNAVLDAVFGGVAPGARIVTQGAELLGQVR